MATTTKKKIRVELSEKLEIPKYWEISGRTFRRTLAGGDFISVLPDDLPDTHPFLFRQVEILRPGTYNWWDFTSEEMAEIGANFRRDDPRPLQVDHSKSAHDCHGRVVDIYLDHEIENGPRVLGLVLFLGAHAVERVLDLRWSRYSAGLWLHPAKLDELSVTNWPACPTAQNLKESEEPMEDDEIPAEGNTTTEGSQPATELSQNEYVDAPGTAELAALRAENERLKAEFAQQQAELTEARVRKDLIDLVRSGQSTPAIHELEVQFCLGLDDDKRQSFVALRRAMKPLWSRERLSKPDLSRSVDDVVEADKARLKQSLEAKR